MAFDSKPRRTMAQADAKNLKTALIVFSAIFFVVYCLFFFNIGDNFFHYYFKNAGIAWKVLGIVSISVQGWFLWTKFGKLENTLGAMIPAQQIALFAWPLVNVFLLAGFAFPLPK